MRGFGRISYNIDKYIYNVQYIQTERRIQECSQGGRNKIDTFTPPPLVNSDPPPRGIFEH